MKPKVLHPGQIDILQTGLEDLLDMNHLIVLLTNQIN